MFAAIASMNYHEITALIAVRTLNDHQIGMQMYHSNFTSWTDWSNCTRTPFIVFEPEPLNSFKSNKTNLPATFEEEPLNAYIWEQEDIPARWNPYWTEADMEGGGPNINSQVLG